MNQMNFKHVIYKLSALVCILVLFSACGKDRSNELKELTDVQHWIYDTMEEWYYWYKELPERKDVRFTDKPKAFFGSLLSDKDGTRGNPFSYIEDNAEIPISRSIHQTQYSYGIAFTPLVEEKTNKLIGVFVNYIAEGSPADEAGLQRGDLILSIYQDSESLTPEDVQRLVGGGPLSTVSYIRPPFDSEFVSIRKTSLPAARAVVDQPTYLTKKLDSNTGYLVYNHFTPGNVDKKARDLSYNQDLHDKIASDLIGTKDLILDLRYNGGGYVSCAELLMALIGPREIINQTVGYMKYNSKKVAENATNYKPQILATAQGNLSNSSSVVNLDIERLFVITSQNTASASEIIINSLNTFIPVYVIGETTVGKNVGSIGFDKGSWHIQPIVCQIFNNNHFTDYSAGFQPGIYHNGLVEARPDWEVSEIEQLFNRHQFGQLGEINEPVLAKVMNVILSPGEIKEANTRSFASKIKAYPIQGLHTSRDLIINK